MDKNVNYFKWKCVQSLNVALLDLNFRCIFTVENTRIQLKVLSGKQRKTNNLSVTSGEKADSILYKGLAFLHFNG